MKKAILAVLALLMAGCAAQKPAETKTDLPMPDREDLPVKVYCQRCYEYGDSVETEDPEVIQALLSQIASLEYGEESTYMVDDFTDILYFQYEDGTVVRYEFEENNYVAEDGKRYRTEGLSALRTMLDELFQESY